MHLISTYKTSKKIMLAPKESQSHVSAKRNLEMYLKQVIPGNCTSTALI